MNDPRLRRHELGFLELVDKPSPQQLSDYYSEHYYQQESASYRKSYTPLELSVIKMRVAQRAAYAATLRGCDLPGRLLDVGCGEGFVLHDYRARGWCVRGIDFSRAGVELMNPDCGDVVDQGDVFQLLDVESAKGNTYDLVWLGNVLEHVLEPVHLLQSLRRLTSGNGLVVVTVPNDGSHYQEQLLAEGDLSNRFWIAVPDHISYFTAPSLAATAGAAGWTMVGLLGDFPIDLYLAHPGSNYVADRSRGPDAHRARLRLEHMIGMAGTAAANRFYESLAAVGLGRNITGFLRARN